MVTDMAYIFRIRTREKCLETLTLVGHSEFNTQKETSSNISNELVYCISEQRLDEKGETVLRITKYRNLWKGMNAHTLKRHST